MYKDKIELFKPNRVASEQHCNWLLELLPEVARRIIEKPNIQNGDIHFCMESSNERFTCIVSFSKTKITLNYECSEDAKDLAKKVLRLIELFIQANF